ncbi:hypothetical protein BHM03_00044290 [Ensete ventricosum]|nr:hypothetical protein BHM03_00044290 [Ensete ventricosum]
MKADHDLDTTVTEGSLAVIRGRYSIPVEYRLHVSRPGQRPYSSDAPGMCISVDALEASLRFPLYPLIEECLKWWRISPSQVAPSSWRYLVMFLGECRGAGIILTRDLFMACFHLCKSRGGYYLTARVSFWVSGAPSNNKGWKSRYLFVSDRMDLDDLHGMPKISSGKAPSTRAAAPAWEVGVSPAREAPKALSKRPINTPTEQVDDPARRHKKVKVLTRRHKSRHGEEESRSHSKGKEPAALSEELETPVESNEGGASPVDHIHGLPDLPPSVGTRRPKVWRGSGGSRQGRGACFRARTGARENQAGARRGTLAARGLRKRAEQGPSNLAEIQRLLKETRVRARKMDNELLQDVKALENARAELPRQSVDRYKESIGFKEGLKRMG